ncbi:MAG: AAA family ATPase [Gemmatimonadaceae bacterium]
MLTLRTLGQLNLRDGDVPLLGGRRKPLALVAYLARQRGRSSLRESLAALLWGQSADAPARQSLRQALSELRQSLGVALDADGPNIQLSEHALHVDANEFDELTSAGDFSGAVKLWNGDFLAGLDDIGDEGWRSWLDAERVLLRARFAGACDQCVRLHLSSGEWNATIAVAERWVQYLPGDERAAIALVNALRASGRGTDAAAHYAESAVRLRAETGEAPSAEFLRLGKSVASLTPTSTASVRDASQQDSRVAVRSDVRALLSPDLVGRSAAFTALSSAWRAVRDSHESGHVVVIEGDEGFGKSRLAEEFARGVRQERARNVVVLTRAFAAERTRDYATLRSLIVQIADAPGAAAAPPEALAALAEVAPEVREHFRNLPSGVTSDLAAHLARVLTEVAAEAPVLLVVDDAPDADAASLALLASLVRRPPPRVLLVLTGRGDAWAASELVDGHHRVGGTDHSVERVTLSALSETETLAMIASMVPLDGHSATRLAAQLHRVSGGNPSLVQLLFTQLASDGNIAPDNAGHWRVVNDVEYNTLPLPALLRETVRAQHDALSPSARRVADAAAIADPRTNVELLEAMSRLSAAQFQEAIGELLSRRVLRRSPSGARYEFPSETNQRIAAELVAPSRRAELERAARGRAGWWASPRATLVAASLLVVLIAGAGFAMSRAHRTGTRVGPVLLADIVNLTGDSLFNRALYPAATVALQESRQVDVFSRTRVRETLRLMSRPISDTLLDETLAREVAARENLAAVLVLSIARFDQEYLLTARAVDPVNGRDLFASSEHVANRARIIAGIDALMLRVRRSLGERADTVRSMPNALPRITTSSLEALQAYADGQRAWIHGQYGIAGDDFRRAIALDSNFALAHVALADLYFVSTNNQALGNASLDHALRLADRLTPREQLALRLREARYRGPESREDELVRKIAEQYPSRESWYTAGTTLMRHRQCPQAIELLQRALALDSMFANAHINLATCEQFLADFPAAIASYAHAWHADSSLMFTTSLNHEWGAAMWRVRGALAADTVFRKMLGRNEPSLRARGFRSLAYLGMTEGRYSDAVRNLDSAIALTRAANDTIAEWRNLVIQGEALLTLGDSARAREVLRVAHARQAALSLASAFLIMEAHADGRAGLLDLASANARVVANRHSDLQREVSNRELLNAQITLAAHKPREALMQLSQVSDSIMLPWVRSLRAQAYVLLGHPDSAMVELRALTGAVYFGYEVQDEWLRAPVRIARLARQMGDSVAAREAYKGYADRFVRGDSALPELREARAMLAGRVTDARGRQ